MVFFAILLYQSGDVEKNPGPTSVSSDKSNESFKFPPLQGNLSMVHYNVQSLANKVDLIESELTNFDIISLTETWLNDSISNEDLTFKACVTSALRQPCTCPRRQISGFRATASRCSILHRKTAVRKTRSQGCRNEFSTCSFSLRFACVF